MKNRSIAMSIILTLVTCGLYGIYWMIVLTDDVVYANEREVFNTSGGAAVLFGILSCGLYYVFWSYQMGKAMQVIQEKRNVKSSDNSLLYVILLLFGLNIVNMCIIQNDLNNLPNNA